MTANKPTRPTGKEGIDTDHRGAGPQFGPILDVFRALESPVLTAADVSERSGLTEDEARAALRQLEVDGVAMSRELPHCRVWWLESSCQHDDLAAARQAQEDHERVLRAARSDV